MPAPYRRLGRITKAHGTHGEVSVAPRDGVDLSDLDGVDVWIVPPPATGATARRITDVRPGPKGSLVRISGADTAATAHELAGRWLLARGDELPGAAAGADDLIGLEVRDVLRGSIGFVTDVIVTGANDVLVIDGGPFGQVLVPVIEEVVISVDENLNVLAVALLEGLLDEDDS